MLFASDDAPKRPDYIYRRVCGGFVGYSADARPSINWKHIDGPLLCCRDGQLHWLTLWERLCCWLGWENAESIERKRRPDLQ